MTPDLARSLGHRLRNKADARGVDAARMRRHFVFQRILARLASSGQWVLKGGFCLEIRLGLDARATKDMDLALLPNEQLTTPLDVQDFLASALDGPDGADPITFEVALPVSLSADDLGNPGWRAKVQLSINGNHFETVKIDIVLRSDEVEGGTETIEVPSVLADQGFESVMVPAVDIAQHAAEKIHPYARVYAHDRPSSRVKDLVDLALLVDTDLLPAAFAGRVRHVFSIRDSQDPPDSLPTPPASWRAPYASLARELSLGPATSDAAWELVDAAYRTALGTVLTKDQAP